MKHLLLLFSMVMVSIQSFAQESWLRAKYFETDFQRRLKTERNLVDKIKADTVYVIWFNATIHNPEKLYPHILWYHRGDSIVVYSIKAFHSRKYVVLDTAAIAPMGDMEHKDCFNHGGWDMLGIYVHGKMVNSAVFDQICILDSSAEDDLEKSLKHDIALLQKKIPVWITPSSSIHDVKTPTTTRQNTIENIQ